MGRRNSPFSNDEEDRVSKLPETLINHILSFLDMKYVIQTSVLSRRWRYIWISVPTLKFDSNIFVRDKREQMVRFIDFVDRVFIIRGSFDIQKFHLVWHDAECDMITSRLNTWILGALRRNVKELAVGVDVHMTFQLPQCLFTCKSLTKLELVLGGKENSKIVFPNSMDLPQLKSLILGSLSLGDVRLTNKLFSSCPLLESLIVRESDIATDDQMNFSIYSLELKHFELNNRGYLCSPQYNMAEIIKLNAPNLTSFYCKDYLSQDYYLENLSSLVTADIDMILEEKGVAEDPKKYSELSAEVKEAHAKRMMKFLRALHNAKELKLSPGFLEVISGAPDLLDRRPPQFSNLECLKLQTWLSRGCLLAITYLLKISRNIESLFLKIAEDKVNSEDVGDNWEARLSLSRMFSHLKFVEIRGIEGSVNELKFLEFLLKNAMALEEVVLFCRKGDSSGKVRQLRAFKKKLRTLPRASSNIALFVF